MYINSFIVTELWAGTLKQLIEEIIEGPRLLKDKEILRQISNGLAYLHSLKRPIVHRDIKPSNILISVTRGQMKLADLGISRELQTNQEDFTNTSVTNPNGTRGWIAPELYYHKRYDLKADI